MRKVSGHDSGKLYAMKVLKKATIVQKAKTAEHTRTERQVLEHIRQSPFLVTLHYAFQTDTKLHLILGEPLFFFSICPPCLTAKTGVKYILLLSVEPVFIYTDVNRIRVIIFQEIHQS